ncbi:MAG: glutamine synthetase III, partial [Myxococcales bacterium]|nr:glutamine synthetase III [Myxococcales bacterium]
MGNELRTTAISLISQGGEIPLIDLSQSTAELFGSNVFDFQTMKERLPKAVFKSLQATINDGQALDLSVADVVASAMKDWALEKGATHYAHVFFPLTGLTAEKHDSFYGPDGQGGTIAEFSGKTLIQGEPDASSFPNGGLRATFEARGYTAWDVTSPAYILENPNGATLCIPTAFVSWTGEALDKKTPVLRSMQVLDKQARRLLALFGGADAARVVPTCGPEQEYFLVDKNFVSARPDLIACGRTLFGAPSPKGQEFDDHYFGRISQRVLRYMRELEHELWLLGIPVRTRHNEVAPTQFELAPEYQSITVSADQNMLTMDLMQEVAERHGLRCLLHCKPYANLNGSGKHVNWSLSDDLGHNLFDPGSTPQDNRVFMVFLTAILRGVDQHQDLLRAAIASAGNDHRLGANEAPPAILSVFVGAQLEEVVNSIIERRAPEAMGGERLKLGVTALPDLPRDISDRNRTSPFAFTGNKFEFRAVSSDQSIAYPATFLNLIMAESLDRLADAIEQRGGPSVENIQAVVRESLEAHRRILFSGDNYSQAW